MLRWLCTAGAACAALSLVPEPAKAFTPSVHRQITLEALRHGPVGLRPTRDAFWELLHAANGRDVKSALVSHDALDHFDDGEIHASNARVMDNRRKAISAFNLGRPRLGLEYLGRALHAIQDFYSHSNYVEIAGGQPLEELGREPIRMEVARRDEFTCPDSPDSLGGAGSWKLTSGEFIWKRLVVAIVADCDAPPARGRCRHGAPGCPGIATDEPPDDVARLRRFKHARSLAIEASRSFVEALFRDQEIIDHVAVQNMLLELRSDPYKNDPRRRTFSATAAPCAAVADATVAQTALNSDVVYLDASHLVSRSCKPNLEYRWSFGASGAIVAHRFAPGESYAIDVSVSDGSREYARAQITLDRDSFDARPDPPALLTIE